MRKLSPGSVLEIFLSHRDRLVSYATPIVGCPSAAEDVVQEAYIRYSPRADSPSIKFRVGYLYRTVHNLALDAAYAQARTRNFVGAMLEAAPPEPAPSPEQEVADRQALTCVADAVAALPPRTRQIFEQHRLEGLTLQQIADYHEISVTRVHQIFRQAMTSIADALDGVE